MLSKERRGMRIDIKKRIALHYSLTIQNAISKILNHINTIIDPKIVCK